MAELTTVARPYADAAFMAAKEEGSIVAYSEQLTVMAEVAAHPQIRELLANPAIKLTEKSEVFFAATGQLNSTLKNLVTLLVENQKFDILPFVHTLFEQQKREHQQSARVIIHSALPINDQQVAEIVQSLERKYGRRMEPEVRLDATLIGGVRIQVGDEVISASVRDMLDRMTRELMQ